MLTGAAPGPKNILFLGDSITAGYGLEPSQSYPALIQEKIDEKKWPFRAVNAGQSGDTSAGGLNRMEWLLRSPVDVLVLELGGNDALRGLPPETTRQNLQAIIELTRKKYPQAKIILAGMKVPPNMGAGYAGKFNSIYPELAKKHNALLIPFVLDNVGGIRELNLPDGIHPTAKGHEIVAANVWKVLEPVLQSLHGK
ncbi:MAG TPA: arylesterase [Candidatus Limnocylindrales bacterium]|nr:arylesterase [Candidatus Limnocylindrales bacterium]